VARRAITLREGRKRNVEAESCSEAPVCHGLNRGISEVLVFQYQVKINADEGLLAAYSTKTLRSM
jgi:hypothetical protein